MLPTRSAPLHDDPSHMPHTMGMHCPKEERNITKYINVYKRNMERENVGKKVRRNGKEREERRGREGESFHAHTPT